MNRAFPLVSASVEETAQGMRVPGMHLEAIHEYTRADGSPWWWIARWRNSTTGEKRPLPFHFEEGACIRKMPDIPHGKRPLYRLHKLEQYRADLVYLVEGETCADCLEGLGFIATTWPNGSQSVKTADWSPLAGRRVVLWPDNDVPGFEAMEEARRILEPLGALVVALDVERLVLPPKGDCVDWLRAFVARHGARHLHEITNGHDLAAAVVEGFEVKEWKVAA